MCSPSKTDSLTCSRSASTSNPSPSPCSSDARSDRAAMLPVPSLPRPVPLRTPGHASASGCSSPPRKKAARAESPTTVAVASGNGVQSGAAALRLRCESCNTPHDGSYGSGRFCAVHCARRTAAALKWSKKRAGQSSSASAHPAGSSRVSVRPASLPPLPPNGSNLGKRPLAVVAPAIAPPMDMARAFPFHYAHSCHSAPTYTFIQPPFMAPTGAPLVQTASSLRTEPQNIRAKGEVNQAAQEAVLMAYTAPAPAAIPVAMQMPFQVPYGYTMSYGAPYVPVHCGPVQVAPTVTPTTFTTSTVVARQDGSGKLPNPKTHTSQDYQQAEERKDEERKQGDGRGSEKDSAAAAQVLLSMRGED